MPAIPEALGLLVKDKILSKFLALGRNPMGSPNPSYFISFCDAIGKGIAQGTKTINFTTKDVGFMGVPPVPGVGTGVGIKVDAEYMSEQMYTYARDSIVAKWPTQHEPWPPNKGNSGEFLRAVTDGVSEAVKEHYAKCWILMSNHPNIYAGAGVIDPNIGTKFSGIVDSAVASAIQGFGTTMKGPFWPDFCKSIAKGYMDGIHKKTTGEVVIIGVCIPLIPPAGAQLCNLPGTGDGTGAAT